MTWYVPNGNKSERCRAKDPAHCRYHVGKDGTVMQHYSSLEACRKAIEEEAKRRNTDKRSLSKTGKMKKSANKISKHVLDLNNLHKPDFAGNTLAEVNWEQTVNEFTKTGSEARLQQQKDVDALEERRNIMREEREGNLKACHNRFLVTLDKELNRLNDKASSNMEEIDQLRKDGKDAEPESLIGRRIAISEDSGIGAMHNVIFRTDKEKEEDISLDRLHNMLHSRALVENVESDSLFFTMTMKDDEGHRYYEDTSTNFFNVRAFNDRLYDENKEALETIKQLKEKDDKTINGTKDMLDHYRRAANSTREPEAVLDINDGWVKTENKLRHPSEIESKLDEFVRQDKEHIHELETRHDRAALKLAGIQAMSSMHYTSEEDRKPLVDKLTKTNAGLGDFDVLGTNDSKSRFLIRTHDHKKAEDTTALSIVDGRGRTVTSSIKDDDGTVRKLRLENLDVSVG